VSRFVVDANGQLGLPYGIASYGNELAQTATPRAGIEGRVAQTATPGAGLKATTERQSAVIALQEGQIAAVTASIKQQRANPKGERTARAASPSRRPAGGLE